MYQIAKCFWLTIERRTTRLVQRDSEFKTLFEEKAKAKDHFLSCLLIQEEPFPSLAKFAK